MGVFRFERRPLADGGKNMLEFDSSYDRAISHAFGYEEGSVELRQKSADAARIIYDVYARDHRGGDNAPPKPLTKRGVLFTLTPAEIRRRQDQYLDMSPVR